MGHIFYEKKHQLLKFQPWSWLWFKWSSSKLPSAPNFSGISPCKPLTCKCRLLNDLTTSRQGPGGWLGWSVSTGYTVWCQTCREKCRNKKSWGQKMPKRRNQCWFIAKTKKYIKKQTFWHPTCRTKRKKTEQKSTKTLKKTHTKIRLYIPISSDFLVGFRLPSSWVICWDFWPLEFQKSCGKPVDEVALVTCSPFFGIWIKNDVCGLQIKIKKTPNKKRQVIQSKNHNIGKNKFNLLDKKHFCPLCVFPKKKRPQRVHSVLRSFLRGFFRRWQPGCFKCPKVPGIWPLRLLFHKLKISKDGKSPKALREGWKCDSSRARGHKLSTTKSKNVEKKTRGNLRNGDFPKWWAFSF